jgi:Uma2 family endonuclease
LTTATIAPEERFVLHHVSWETYEGLLEDHIDRGVPRFTYDRGELEILTPSSEHEIDNRSLALLVELVAVELDIETLNVGSMTCNRRDLERGFEPDSGFYIQNEARVRGRSEVDLAVDPPPDVTIEIEISRSAIPKLPIYAAIGVPEVWPWDGERVTILVLRDGDYDERLVSAALPPITSEILMRFMNESRSMRRTAWVQRVREWAREQDRGDR